MAQLLRKLGRYELIRRIAVGGMGELFLARLRGTAGFEKLVIIKTILPHLSKEEEFVTKFLDEGRIVVQLTHGNIVPVFDMDESDGEYYIAMEYVPGRDLREVLKRLQAQGDVLPVDMALHLASEVCKGLGYAHRKVNEDGESLGLVHRDVSPSNILVSSSGEVKVIDFGIARATNKISQTVSGRIQGKFCYMSPEQASGKPLDQRSDICSLGIVLYEMLTGVRPFEGETDLETLDLVRSCKFDPPSMLRPQISSSIDEILSRTLSQDPGDRYTQIDQLQVDLLQHLYLHGEPPTSTQITSYLVDLFPEGVERKELCVRTSSRSKSKKGKKQLVGASMSLDDALDLEFERLGSDPLGERALSYTPSQPGVDPLSVTEPSQGPLGGGYRTATLIHQPVSPDRVAVKTPLTFDLAMEQRSVDTPQKNEAGYNDVDVLSHTEDLAPDLDFAPDVLHVPLQETGVHTYTVTVARMVVALVVCAALVSALWLMFSFVMPSSERTVRVMMHTQPKGARIYINGALEMQKRTPAEFELSAKTYKVRFEHEGYESSGALNLRVHKPEHGSVLLFPAQPFEFKKQMQERTIIIDSTPAHASVVWNGKEIGLTPIPFKISGLDKIYIKLNHKGCEGRVVEITPSAQLKDREVFKLTGCKKVSAGVSVTQTSKPAAPDVRSRRMDFRIEVEPKDAKIFVNGARTKSNPAVFKDLPISKMLTIQAKKRGYKTKTIKKSVRATHGRITLKLEPEPMGCVFVQITNPSVASLHIDGRRIKGKNADGRVTSIKAYPLTVGKHKLKAWNEIAGKSAVVTDFIVKPGPCVKVNVWSGKVVP